MVEHIHEYLRSVGENVRAGQMKSEDFIIFKVCTWSYVRLPVDIRTS